VQSKGGAQAAGAALSRSASQGKERGIKARRGVA